MDKFKNSDCSIDGLDYSVQLPYRNNIVPIWNWCSNELPKLLPDVEFVSVPIYDSRLPFVSDDHNYNAYRFYFNSESAIILFKLQGF
jgi:hypothetical protein